MKVAVFVDTYALTQAQEHGGEPEPPIIVYDLDRHDGTAWRTTEVEVLGPAVMRFEMAPEHNLARVWVEGDAESFSFMGTPVFWNVRQGT